MFRRIGFTAKKHASAVSFAELLRVPTIGKSDLEVDDLVDDSNVDHLRDLNRAIEFGKARYIFIPPDVAELMQESRMFPKIQLNRHSAIEGQTLRLWDRWPKSDETEEKLFYRNYHFSNWGIHEAPTQNIFTKYVSLFKRTRRCERDPVKLKGTPNELVQFTARRVTQS